jgi:hypothetical protein
MSPHFSICPRTPFDSPPRSFSLRILIVVASCLSLAILPAACAHEGHEEAAASVQSFDEREQHRPTPLPDRVVLTWSGDPTSSIDVSWRTSLGVNAPLVEYAAASSLRGNMAQGDVPTSVRVTGQSVEFSSDLDRFLLHSAHLEDLQAATMYAYRVGDGTRWSEWFQFRTASQTPEPFSFIYFGDAQNAVRSLWSRVIREASQHAPRSAFMLHAGDLVNHGNRDAEWGEWFGAGSWLNGMIPSIATPGNHEYSGGGLSRHWRPQFCFPLNGPEGLEESVYWLDYQGLRIISLNSNEKIEEQIPWLEKVLSDPARPKWTLVTFHHPVFSAAKDRDNPTIRAAWQPLLEEHGVDLVLQGHDHAYNRSSLGGPTNANIPEGVRRQSSNTVYVVSVSGPKMYPLQQEWDVERVASGVQLFQVIRVSQEEIRYEARLAEGDLYDAFTLRKDGDVSELIEQVPPTDEVRR